MARTLSTWQIRWCSSDCRRPSRKKIRFFLVFLFVHHALNDQPGANGIAVSSPRRKKHYLAAWGKVCGCFVVVLHFLVAPTSEQRAERTRNTFNFRCAPPAGATKNVEFENAVKSDKTEWKGFQPSLEKIRTGESIVVCCPWVNVLKCLRKTCFQLWVYGQVRHLQRWSIRQNYTPLYIKHVGSAVCFITSLVMQYPTSYKCKWKTMNIQCVSKNKPC